MRERERKVKGEKWEGGRDKRGREIYIERERGERDREVKRIERWKG